MRYLIPIAAPESMFPREEYHFPKPQIEVDGAPMIARVIENLSRGDPDPEFVFVVRAEDCREFSLDHTLRLSAPGRCEIVTLERAAQGAACSALLAIAHIDDDKPLVVANGDQLFDYDLARVFADFRAQALDAGVISFSSVHPRWSYVRVDDHGLVTEAAEKRVISRSAIAGFYYFARGADFVRCAQSMILNDRSVDGRFFIAPALNEAVLAGLRVGLHEIPPEAYHSLYSPQRVELFEQTLQAKRMAPPPASGGELQIVIPMAGRGSRFADAGYALPKPLIDVMGKTMIEQVMDNLRVPGARYVLLAQREHLEREPKAFAELAARGDVRLLPVDGVTEGAACTVLLARRELDPDAPLLIANCDQIIDFDCTEFVRDADARNLDGSILCFRDPALDPKWSFALTDRLGHVVQVAEKKPISDLATVGLYYFRRAGDFVDAALDMIVKNDRSNNEFYVCPVYNYAIANGLTVGVQKIPMQAMHGIGTPADLDAYLAAMKTA